MPVFEKFAGTTNGGFFEAPAWVDKTKPPGHTSQAATYGRAGWWKGYVTLGYFFNSPNFVWWVIAAFAYLAVPYDIPAAKTFSLSWVLPRLYLNAAVTLAYGGFWHLATTTLHVPLRKFNPLLAGPPLVRLLHNVWYSCLGIAQWTAIEAGFLHMYASGRLGYVADETILASPVEMVKLAAWILFVPLWRDLHFYFAHRLIHTRAIYKYVHSLHHRNTDIDAFSGLCMHPVEHLYYFLCVGPSLYIHASPFIMMWNGYHLLLSPAASHSGWEDHFQADQFHYLHHAKFECNYGTSGVPFDLFFGTFREKLGKSATYHGEANDAALLDTERETTGSVQAVASIAVNNTGKSYRPAPGGYLTLKGFSLVGSLPSSGDHAAYLGFTVALFAGVVATVLDVGGVRAWLSVPGLVSHGQLLGFLVAVGPVLAGALLLVVTNDQKSLVWPFNKERMIGAFGFHLVTATVMVVLPCYHYMTAILSEPRAGFTGSTYCALWGSC